ncbi:hypothetical protein KTN05_10660 [Paracoccus sp. Z118]|uniref:hypothetical protein n=1 Tax=Paracoccus sp. Z118 TaxID=2851017 RepID=UPI001C2CB92A|nr:hypothetical protein [Paracoccus sp. Z118]MBV0892312.1 hypothetical protein [Paracoccus sp. Z118]
MTQNTDAPRASSLGVAVLHNHWIKADSINYHLRRSLRLGPKVESGMTDDLNALAQTISAMHVLSVWYGLLWVVVEGYRELKLTDKKIDELLASDDMIGSFRRFRNAVFHFQEEPLSPKLMDFITAPASERWVNELNRSFDRFFSETLNLKEVAAQIKADHNDLASGENN